LCHNRIGYSFLEKLTIMVFIDLLVLYASFKVITYNLVSHNE
jgi:hypothetical protein